VIGWQGVAMFPWLLPADVEPVTRIDPGDPLLRYAHCDGSAAPLAELPHDLIPSSPSARLAGRVPPGAVVCMTTAWSLHAGRHADVVDLVGVPTRLPIPGTRTFYMELHEGDVGVEAGLRVTTLLRTAFDLARLAPVEVAAQALTDLRPRFTRAQFDAFAAVRSRSRDSARALRLSSMVLR
jgi:hypothetical protein